MTSQKITLNGKHQQLVDLNDDKTNFITEFTITPHTLDLEKTYYASVVTQSQLDNGDDIDFNKLNGIYKGKVENRNNTYQNYFLAIKSDSQLKDVEIKVDLEELPFTGQQEREMIPPMEEMRAQPPPDTLQLPPKKDEGRLKLKYIIALFVIVCGGFLLYYFWKKGKNQEKETRKVTTLTFPVGREEPKRSISRVVIPEKRFESSSRKTRTEPPRLFKPSSPSPSIASVSSESSSSKSSSSSSSKNSLKNNRFKFEFDD